MKLNVEIKDTGFLREKHL